MVRAPASVSTPPPSHLAEVAALRERIGAEYPFESRWFQAPAGWLHYVDQGTGSAPMVCVHGNPTWSFYFRRVVESFSTTERVIAVDHLGCGLSEKPQDWSYRLADHVANLEALVLSLDLKNITLVLHDWGGAIGMGFATKHPERIGRIVLGNTAAFQSPRLPWRIAASRLPVLGPLLLRGLGAFSRAATTMAVERPLDPLAKRGLLAPYNSWRNRIAQWMFVKDIPMGPRHPSYAELVRIDKGLASLAQKPMAIVWGMHDWCFTPAYIPEWQARFPHASVYPVESANHYLLEDAPMEAIAIYQRFLRSVP